VVRGEASAHRPVCELVDLASGRRLSLSANQPGVQIYTSNFLDGSLSGKGTRYAQHSAICLETQAFPNAINVPTWRGQVVLEPGVTYRHTMTHKFA
jgi:aldose 1-epimerase